MVIDPGDWLPLAGLSMIAACTALGVAGAWAMGRARGERLGEVQRFALKVISDKVSEATAPEHMLPQGRVITPH